MNKTEKEQVPILLEEERERRILKLRQQVVANVWIQAFAGLAEAAAVTKLFYLEEQVPGSLEIVHGVWIQVIGTLLEAVGLSEQLLTEDESEFFYGQRHAVTGDWIQSIGGIVEAIGGERVLQDAMRKSLDGLTP